MKIFNGYEGFDYKIYKLLPRDTHIICYIEIIKTAELEIPYSIRKMLQEKKISKKVLILVNNQDYLKSLDFKIINDYLGYPVIGFSATAPKAPERLKQIISKFLID